MAMDFIAGQGPPPGGGGGAPPDLAALLGAGAPGPPGPNDTADPGAQTPVEIVQAMIDAGKPYLDVEKDHEDLLTMQKILTMLQQLLTKDQQDADAIASGVTSPRALRKAFG